MKSSSANGGGSVAANSAMKFANGQNSYALQNGAEKVIDKPPKATNGVPKDSAKCPVPQPVNGMKNTNAANDNDTKNMTIKSDKRKIFTKGSLRVHLLFRISRSLSVLCTLMIVFFLKLKYLLG